MNAPAATGDRRAVLKLAAMAIAAVVVWVAAEPVDLAVSSFFYRPGDGFFLADRLPLRLVYRGTYWYISTAGIALVGSLAWSWLPSTSWNTAWRGRLAFLALSLAIGPGLITNTLFKDHWGRPRPEHLIDFGGQAHYVAPMVPSDQCRRNCSFPSGHAAAGFWLISGAWVWERRRRSWLLCGLAWGGIVGATRIAQGGHFLSDVLAALAVVWLVNTWLSRWMRRCGWLTPLQASSG